MADYYTNQQTPAPADPATDVPATNSNITVQEEAKQRAKAKAFTDKTGTALGNMRSFGDTLGDISRLQARDATSLGQIGDFKQGSSNVLGYELDNANSAGNGLKSFADISGGLGQLGISAGLSRPKTFDTTLGDVIGYQNPKNYFPTAPSGASPLYSLYADK